MIRIVTTLILCVLSYLTLWAQLNNKTYYYERVKIVKNKTPQSASGDGHYLTINQNGLYESDAQGNSKRQGFVKYVNSSNNKPLYEGDAYLGKDLSYVFNSDYSRLNLYLANGTIYVYTRKSTPSSSSALREYSSPNSGVVQTPSYSYESGTSHSNGSSRTSARPEKKYMQCPYCNGTGRVLYLNSGYIYKTQYWVTCSECGQRYLNTSIHKHFTCNKCHGTGKLELR
jgi:hypothetical protein